MNGLLAILNIIADFIKKFAIVQNVEAPVIISDPKPIKEMEPEPTTVRETPAPVMPITVKTSRERIYETAKACLGKDASPADKADDEYGCMETVDEIHKKATGLYINGTKDRVTVSTEQGYEILKRNITFIEISVKDALPGDFLIYATNTSTKKDTPIKNGHILIVAKFGLLSNDSSSGKFMENYTWVTARTRWELNGGYKPHVFRKI